MIPPVSKLARRPQQQREPRSSCVVLLYIVHRYSWLVWKNDVIENTPLLRQVSRQPCTTGQTDRSVARLAEYFHGGFEPLGPIQESSSLVCENVLIILSPFRSGTRSRCDAARKLQPMRSSIYIHLLPVHSRARRSLLLNSPRDLRRTLLHGDSTPNSVSRKCAKPK